MTFDADYSPSDPDVFLGKTITGAAVDPSNTLTIGFSDGSELTVVPRPLKPGEENDDLENWFLLTPDELSLDFDRRGGGAWGAPTNPGERTLPRPRAPAPAALAECA